MPFDPTNMTVDELANFVVAEKVPGVLGPWGCRPTPRWGFADPLVGHCLPLFRGLPTVRSPSGVWGGSPRTFAL
jgi:hypothetical protein